MSLDLSTITKHPNPQFERESYELLNGSWDFGFQKAKKSYTFGVTEKDYKLHKADTSLKITVPFCIESKLSGIGYTDFINRVWYKRDVDITKGDNRVFLNIGAADYVTTLFVNGKMVGSHTGGYTSFKFEITDFVNDGKNELFILCEDDTRANLIPIGKQSHKKKSHGCSYTRTTGIWQSVYLEYTPKAYVKNFKIYPSLAQNNVSIHFDLKGTADICCVAKFNGKEVGKTEVKGVANSTIIQIPLSEAHPWEVGNGQLYDLEITFGQDKIKSYFGLREVALDGFKFLLNGKSVFQRLVLDQGYYRRGIYTAIDDAELLQDITLSMGVGYNGARLHQKVFDPRFLYFCDKLGYIVWGEYANWGIDISNPKAVDIFGEQWAEAIDRDFNHPAIVGWCPFNETWNYHKRKQYDPLLAAIYDYTKAVDKTRPCIDTSGNFHVKTDIYDVHDYRYDPKEFKKTYDKLVTDGTLYEHVLIDNPGRQLYNGEPTFVSEYGGIKWETDKEFKSWGYGVDVKTEEELADRYCGLTEALIDNEKMLGFCYTQLYDVEQEQNGLFTYDREPKFKDEIYDRIRAINTKKAAIED